MTTLRLSDPQIRDGLIAGLHLRPDLVAAPLNENTVEVALFGSYNLEALQLAIYLPSALGKQHNAQQAEPSTWNSSCPLCAPP